jgi:hypothetical protein
VQNPPCAAVSPTLDGRICARRNEISVDAKRIARVRTFHNSHARAILLHWE